MRAFLASLLTILIIAIGAGYVLNVSNRPAYKSFAAPETVQLSEQDAGDNLVGKDWSGS
ncbi:MAG TPA: hypothetical protein VFA53_05005 [Xanthobacteraceae bacterium]|nr:hypothetical protein [Xanthobacteraceae bacterium]